MLKSIYYISTYGRIKNLKGQILKPDKDKDGYLKFTLQGKNGKKIKRFSHRLVGLQFIPNPTNKPEINHINVINKNGHFICRHDDNYYKNLEWVTHKENIQHSRINNLESILTCEDHPMSKVDNDMVHFICLMIENNVENKDIYKILGITNKKDKEQYRSLIKNIKSKKTWKNISKYYNITK